MIVLRQAATVGTSFATDRAASRQSELRLTVAPPWGMCEDVGYNANTDTHPARHPEGRQAPLLVRMPATTTTGTVRAIHQRHQLHALTRALTAAR